MEKYTFLKLAEDILTAAKRPMTTEEMWQYALQTGLADKIQTSGKTPWQTLNARMYVELRDNRSTKFTQVSKHPAKFAVKDVIAAADQEKTGEGSVTPGGKSSCGGQDIQETKKLTYHERDLHILLSSFVKADAHFHCCTKTIYHEKSQKNKKGMNKWLHPDIVGVYYPYTDYCKEVLGLYKIVGENPYRLFSFEVKKSIGFSNLRECYFQAVSNSSWAHEGYLVALDVEKDNELLEEMGRLTSAFGIGIIELNPYNINQSKILFPALAKKSLDWSTIERIADENPDFKAFVSDIQSTSSINVTQYGSFELHGKYDETSSDEEIREYCLAKGILTDSAISAQ